MQTKELLEDMEEDLPEEMEDMDLSELDLEEIEKECSKKGQGYVSRRQLELLQQEILKTKASPHLGISKDPMNGNKRKQPEEGGKCGRKTNRKRIANIGTRMIKSG